MVLITPVPFGWRLVQHNRLILSVIRAVVLGGSVMAREDHFMFSDAYTLQWTRIQMLQAKRPNFRDDGILTLECLQGFRKTHHNLEIRFLNVKLYFNLSLELTMRGFNF